MHEPQKTHTDIAKKIILEIINRKTIVDSIELNNMAEKVLSIVYSIGGGYTEKEIRQISEVKVKEWLNL